MRGFFMSDNLRGIKDSDCQDVYGNPAKPNIVKVGVLCSNAAEKGATWFFLNQGNGTNGNPVEITCGSDKPQNITFENYYECGYSQSAQLFCLTGSAGFCGGIFENY